MKYTITCWGTLILGTQVRAEAERAWARQQKEGSKECHLWVDGQEMKEVPQAPRGKFRATDHGVRPVSDGERGYAFDKAERYWWDNYINGVKKEELVK